MKKTCSISGQKFIISDKDLSWFKTQQLPLPTLSPEERLRRRIGYRNFKNLYSVTCKKTNKKIISMYQEDSSRIAVDPSWWWSDNWSAFEYGRDFDFSKPFFPQYLELAKIVPHYAIMNTKCENCSYSNMAYESKNCYLVFGCVRNEDCLYGHIVWSCKNCVDCLYAFRSELCSHSVDIVDCYNVHYSDEVVNCSNSYFLFDAQNCKNCFGGVNLRNCEYVFFGEQCSKEEYLDRLKKITPLSLAAIKQAQLWLESAKRNAIFPELFGIRVENSSGNHIYESFGLEYCFDTKKSENSSHCYTAFGIENSCDISFTGDSTRFCADCLTMSNCERVFYSHLVINSYDLYYCEHCYGCHDLFGCNGLKNASYCILNKQYSKEEYFKLKEKLVELMTKTNELGEFFPLADSPFAYNESIANEYLPLTKEQILKRGLKWKEDKDVKTDPSKSTLNYQTIAEATDSITKEQFLCAKTKNLFRIIPQELSFYRKTRLPIPNISHEARHLARMALRYPRKLALTSCYKCNKEIQSAHFQPLANKTVCMNCINLPIDI